MVVQHKKLPNRGVFYIEADGEIEAEMVYSLTGNSKMIIEHTEVNEKLRGKNIGFELVKTGVEYARSQGMKIIPICPFANSVFEHKPEFEDVLDKS